MGVSGLPTEFATIRYLSVNTETRVKLAKTGFGCSQAPRTRRWPLRTYSAAIIRNGRWQVLTQRSRPADGISADRGAGHSEPAEACTARTTLGSMP